jgi:hypothetical protein
LLTVPLSSITVACHLGLCEKRLRDSKRATRLYQARWRYAYTGAWPERAIREVVDGLWPVALIESLPSRLTRSQVEKGSFFCRNMSYGRCTRLRALPEKEGWCCRCTLYPHLCPAADGSAARPLEGPCQEAIRSRMVKKLAPGLTEEVRPSHRWLAVVIVIASYPIFSASVRGNGGGKQSHALEDPGGVHHRDGRSRAAVA